MIRPAADPSPMVSLVMPAHNPRPDWFEQALRSALDEAACSVEIIVVDDASQPPVELPFRDRRLRLIRVPRSGPYGARDAGLAIARGSYIRFVDSDDVVIAGSTGRLVDLVGGNTAIGYGQTTMCDDELTPLQTFVETAQGRVAGRCLLGEFDVFHVSMVFPRRVVDAAGPCDVGFRVSGDWDFVLRAVEHAPVRQTGEVVTLYRRSVDSVMSSARPQDGIAARRRVIDRYAARNRGVRNQLLVRRAKGRTHLAHALSSAWRGDRRTATGQLGLGFAGAPLAASKLAVTLLISRVRKGPTP